MWTASVAAVAWPGRGVAQPWRAYSVQLAFRGAQPPSDLRSVP